MAKVGCDCEWMAAHINLFPGFLFFQLLVHTCGFNFQLFVPLKTGERGVIGPCLHPNHNSDSGWCCYILQAFLLLSLHICACWEYNGAIGTIISLSICCDLTSIFTSQYLHNVCVGSDGGTFNIAIHIHIVTAMIHGATGLVVSAVISSSLWFSIHHPHNHGSLITPLINYRSSVIMLLFCSSITN